MFGGFPSGSSGGSTKTLVGVAWLVFLAILPINFAFPQLYMDISDGDMRPVASFDAKSISTAGSEITSMDEEDIRDTHPHLLEGTDIFSAAGDAFIQNRDQVSNSDILFYSHPGNLRLGLAKGHALISLEIMQLAPSQSTRDLSNTKNQITEDDDLPTTEGIMIRTSFKGASEVAPRGFDRLPHPSHFFFGKDPTLWLHNVPSFGKVIYEDLYDGVDLIYRIDGEGAKYEFVISPGSDPGDIEIVYEGVENLEIDSSGNLLIATPLGILRDSAPYSFQGQDDTVHCRFVLRSEFSIGFRCDDIDDSRTLVIDPLIYATFLGGIGSDGGHSIAVDSIGNSYITGQTSSHDFPTTVGAFNRTLDGSTDIFVAKLNDNGSALVYATYLGGSGGESGSSIIVNSDGNVYLTGNTDSADFPTTVGAYDRIFDPPTDAFVTKLSATGSNLEYSTYMGGNGWDYGKSISVGLPGMAYVTGYTSSTDFPSTTGVFGPSYNGGFFDSFVAKLNASGTGLEYSTFLGGDGIDSGYSVTVDSSGHAYVTGETTSNDFPVTSGAFDQSFNGYFDVYVAKLNTTASGLEYSTYLGGANGSDYGRSIAVDSLGNAYVVGDTRSDDFPTTSAALDTNWNDDDAFVTKVNATGSGLEYSTFLGGSRWDFARSITVDLEGSAYVTGVTGSSDFSTTSGAFDVFWNKTDAFAIKLSSTGSLLNYSTFLGGSGGDWGTAIAIDSLGNIYATGDTSSADFPATMLAFDTVLTGTYDAFVLKLNLSSIANTPPTLFWVDDSGYVNDGLNPETGTTGTLFMYKVAYADADNDPPALVRLRIEKPLGTSWGTFSLEPETWMGDVDDYLAGMICAYNTSLFPEGMDYWYYFEANDGADWALGAPTGPIDAPDVTPIDSPPTAIANASATTGYRVDIFTFDATDSIDDFGIVAFHWDFGDGATSDSAIATHTYSLLGSFAVLLTVWDTANQSDNDTLIIEIRNREPLANAGPEKSAYKNSVVTLDGTSSFDPDGDSITFSWAQVAGPAVTVIGQDTSNPWFSPSVKGIYSFVLVVNDGFGGTSSATVNVTVVNRSPIADAGQNLVVQKGTLVYLDGTMSSDPDGDSLNFNWTQSQGPPVTISQVNSPTATFTPTLAGNYTFMLTVDDGDDGSDNHEVKVNVWGLAPIANLSSDVLMAEVGVYIHFDGNASTDPDGTIVSYEYDFGDSSNTSGNHPYVSHSFEAPGEYRVSLKVVDDDGNTSTAIVTITISIPPDDLPPEQENWKPVLATVFALFLLTIGYMSSRRRPWASKSSQKSTFKAFSLVSLPFVALEAATGIVSLVTGQLNIPPLLGLGTAVDVAILLCGVASIILWTFGPGAERTVE